MSRAALIVDGATLLDADLRQFQTQTPEQFADLIKPGHTPQGWRIPAVGIIMQSVLRQQPVTVRVTTQPAGFTLNVNHQ